MCLYHKLTKKALKIAGIGTRWPMYYGNMRRIKELIRLIEYAEEEGNGKPLDTPKSDHYSKEQIRYHIDLREEAGLLNTKMATRQGEADNFKAIVSLTWEGHNVLSEMRGEEFKWGPA